MGGLLKLILASASPQRRKLLKKLGLVFKVVPSCVSERSAEKNPRKLVQLLALRKAKSVARDHPDDWVLGADTIVVCRGQILLKPKNLSDARRILGLLNGRWHKVYTGFALVRKTEKRSIARSVASSVRARRLGEPELLRLAGKHMDKAGAYAVQDHEDPFIAEIRGDFDNVVGLPVAAVGRAIEDALDLAA
ncbi:MAG: septum formation protein Maf [Elusimicrobia bacterium]|nr:septum formation protein Maf [Elusimicrobiota bacterium]